MSGGFTPTLVTTDDPLSGQINVMASEHSMFKAVGATLDAKLFKADAKLNKYVLNGTVVAKVKATGKYGPYDAKATDGRQDPVAGEAGIIVHGGVNLKDGDTIVGILLHGSVLRARLLNSDAALETALSNRIVFQ